MNVHCPNCKTLYRVDPERLPDAGARVRCSRCTTVFLLARNGAAAPGVATAARTGQLSGTPSPMAPPTAAPAMPRPVAAAAAAPVNRPPSAPPAVAPATSRAPVAPPLAAPAASPVPQATASMAPAATRPGPAAVVPGPATVAAGAPGAAAAPAPAPAAAAPAPAAPRRAHSFASADPDARAQRMARALVSDIVAYHPERRDRALAAGTLRTEFRDEIMKSWEEYVAQVGAEMAKKAPHFRSALNEILANGQRIF